MDDNEIQEKVESILGKGAKVIDCEKKSQIKEEEILLINGHRVVLSSNDDMAIKEALRTGQIPPCELLNTVLMKAGILRAPVKLETSLSVKSSIIRKEEITVAKQGKVIDERSRETKEDNFYTSDTSEVWEPLDVRPKNKLPKNCNIIKNSSTSSDSTYSPKQDVNCERSCTNSSSIDHLKSFKSEIFCSLHQLANCQKCVAINKNPYISNCSSKQDNCNSNNSINESEFCSLHQQNNCQNCLTKDLFKSCSSQNQLKDFRKSSVCTTDSTTSSSSYESDNSSLGMMKNDPNYLDDIRSPYEKFSGISQNSSRDLDNFSNISIDSGRDVADFSKFKENYLGNNISRELSRNLETFSGISKDSGNDLSNSVVTSRSSTYNVINGGCQNTFTPTSVSSLSSYDGDNSISELTKKLKNSCNTDNGYRYSILPSIFGTVTSNLTSKDGPNRWSLPQTGGAGSKSYQNIYADENGTSPNCDKLIDSEFSIDNALVYRDGNLISGPLEALIQHMVPTDTYYPDRAFIFAFLLSSRLYIKPHELLAQICLLCDQQQKLNILDSNTTSNEIDMKIPPPEQFSSPDCKIEQKENVLQFTKYLIQLLGEWTETFPYDFRDERLMSHVTSITQKCVMLNPLLRRDVSRILQNLLHQLSKLESYEECLEKFAKNEGCDNDICQDITEVSPNPGILAQQLTHIELERLSYIGPEEFVQAFAKESPHLETSFKDMKKTKNLESYVEWFNRLSYFVATEICKHLKKKQRVKVVEYWIETARECFCIGNFNSLMAIIAGLNISPISRLKKTWHKIQTDKFSVLEHQMDPSSNFSSYRSTLKAAMWRSHGARDERQRIVIPFFSLLVKDLYFLNEGCSNKLPNGHINFEKFWQLAKQVTEFIAWKQVTCPFEKIQRVIQVLQTSPIQNENSLALASFDCEPPENNQEKERYKSLKSELNSTNQ